ncbi:MAG: ABC transporter permease, partial [Betaproteobacteria bacterium]|nr:ABC transporter permease [Betaproteobacteria bacterium]
MENYAIGWRGGFTLRWLAEVWSAYGSTVMASITIASATVFTTILIAVPCAYA